MLICRALSEKLQGYADNLGVSVDEMFQMVLYEIPDEVLEQFHAMADPVEVEVGDETRDVMESMAEDFGFTTVGLSVLMNKLLDRAVLVHERLAGWEAKSVANKE